VHGLVSSAVVVRFIYTGGWAKGGAGGQRERARQHLLRYLHPLDVGFGLVVCVDVVRLFLWFRV
jgi:hypothetical protein